MGRRAREIGRPQAALTVAREIANLAGFEEPAQDSTHNILEIITQHTSQAA
jgi:hypothetical protein